MSIRNSKRIVLPVTKPFDGSKISRFECDGGGFREKDRQEHMAKKPIFVQMFNSDATDEHGLLKYAKIEQRKLFMMRFLRKNGRTLRNFITMD